MTERTDEIRYARRFVIRRGNEAEVHGIQFPSGRILCDNPAAGLQAATSIDHISDLTDGATIHWADEEQQ